MPRSRTAGSRVSSILTFLRNRHTDFHNGCTNLHSHQQCTRAPFSPPTHQHLLPLVFLVKAILIGGFSFRAGTSHGFCKISCTKCQRKLPAAQRMRFERRLLQGTELSGLTFPSGPWKVPSYGWEVLSSLVSYDLTSRQLQVLHSLVVFVGLCSFPDVFSLSQRRASWSLQETIFPLALVCLASQYTENSIQLF